MKKVLPILISLALILFDSSIVSAQTVVAPELYSAIQKKLLIDEFLQGRDPNSLNESELESLVSQALATGQVPDVGLISEDKGIITAITGLTGISKGSLAYGEYQLEVNPISEIEVTLPKSIVVSGLASELKIALTESSGKGKVEYQELPNYPAINLITNPISKIISDLKFKTLRLIDIIINFVRRTNKSAPSQTLISTTKTVPLTITLFRDANGNRLFDTDEKPVPWANVKIRLTKISREEELKLNPGRNTLKFSPVPKNLTSAYKILLEAGGEASEVILIDNKRIPESATYKANAFFGEDFAIYQNEDYTLIVPDKTTLTLVY